MENCRRSTGGPLPTFCPNADAVGQEFFDYADYNEPPFALMNQLEEPGKQLDDYRFRLARAIGERVSDLRTTVGKTLLRVVESVPRDPTERLDDPRAQLIADAISEIERLLGDTTERKGRWVDLHRHMNFGQGHDWHDFVEFDWTFVRVDIEATSLSQSDPLPVNDIDLGAAASTRPTGGVTIGLVWDSRDADRFERLLFDLSAEHERWPEPQRVVTAVADLGGGYGDGGLNGLTSRSVSLGGRSSHH